VKRVHLISAAPLMIFDDKNVTATPQVLSLTQENAVDLHSVV